MRERTCRQPVVVLGAGINGAAIARELVLQGVPVCLVDASDLGGGTTAYSSRLIHGGLRYLEHGEWGLVKESLAERGRLLRLAPDDVEAVRLFIPVARQWGGWFHAARQFLCRQRAQRASPQRGGWLIGFGLWLYDRFDRQRLLPSPSRHRVGDPHLPRVHPRYRWLHAYSDAQMRYPERFVLSLLHDAAAAAQALGVSFEVRTYHRAVFSGGHLELRRCDGGQEAVATLDPLAVVNATGAWVDQTLAELGIPCRRLIGGTKGSHLFTRHAGLRAEVAAGGVYAEAADGRPVFILPLRGGTLVGTTDLPFAGDPRDARAADAEVAYLLGAVKDVFPQLDLTLDDVFLRSAGVRPLPLVGRRQPGAITRRHGLKRHRDAPCPLFSVVGGKLTTARSLAEQVTDAVLGVLGLERVASSRDRPISPPSDQGAMARHGAEEKQQLASRLGLTVASVEAVWDLCGHRAAAWLTPPAEISAHDLDDRRCVLGTVLPRRFVRQVIAREWVQTLQDLVERRLMLLYDDRISEQTLIELASLIAEHRRSSAQQIDEAVTTCVKRLVTHFGRSDILRDDDPIHSRP